ncbi:lytic polysaccharide monooxygenase auxiliary activity family 9 protein [Aspergillus clavatus NRRL 1]|uniref:AA9 family lytic polysaccharide monooxygenase n=1 Tax=Aspergillus clavatus (strain ATCC 1007 / CBS 513.65 / DSM 816 / NCTC 3887 / NRRL 1 / QM 1276 / 107) TaxID=344612 RepID=A1C9D5_ASPCL|nr:endoglucanase, putative [Aspergillus clavatus NRRL 1]EAW13459.1 endoglucanase, putative [Aspergillus clavatus NRRL 1]
MKLSLLALSAIAPLVSAHYFFDVLVIDGKETKSNEFVRSNTRPAKYNPTKWVNIRDDMTPDVTDFRCNKGAFTFAGKTGTAEVKAGSKLAMKLAVGATFQHPGPGLVYMSKAPSAAKAYQGDNEWFKIHEESVCNKNADFTRDAWCTWGKDRIEFTIPADLPDGEYLIRPEHIGVHGAHVGQAEFYNTCAQVKVVGGGNGTPGPTVKFPGAYKKNDPSFNFSIYQGYKEYPMPGPAVWTGGSGSHSGSNVHNATESTAPETNASPTTAPSHTSAPQATAPPSKGSTGTCSGRRKRRHARAFDQ